MAQTDPSQSQRRRLKFSSQLEQIFLDAGLPVNLYFEPPASVRMKYPAIIYSRDQILNRNADNAVYMQRDEYLVTVVDKDPDSYLVRAVSELPKSRWERGFVVDNLHHSLFSISE